ncbi:hypothetical protein M2103_001013 [Ereboglobus sp. PH5-5]|uniref:hypothetical protein n=1 Tax=Ereboglobus sp. PH5-5 TaxID=2940529 RepID=UPI002404C13B|nr:hypothetical protein [Ereboglobus sp. PH5-5]MDF9832799.1 hypothetical protein [Ereboglobus sp. PH5-5]
MFIILGSDGVEYGPVDAATVKAWLNEGRAVLQTKARRADSPEWQTLAAFPEFAENEAPPPLPESARKTPVTIDAEAYAADLIARAKPLDVIGCISRGWAFYKSDFGPILGVTLLTLLLMNAVPFGALIATGLGMAGIYYYYLGKMRGQQRRLSDVFVGFSRMTAPLIVGNLAIFGIVLACMLPIYVFVVIGAVLQSPVGLVMAVVGGLAGMAVVLYISVVLNFVFPLIIDKNLDWRDAMKVSRRVIGAQFWRFLLLMVLAGLISCLGLLLFLVGVYLLVPLTIASYAQAYEDLCNPKD